VIVRLFLGSTKDCSRFSKSLVVTSASGILASWMREKLNCFWTKRRSLVLDALSLASALS